MHSQGTTPRSSGPPAERRAPQRAAASRPPPADAARVSLRQPRQVAIDGRHHLGLTLRRCKRTRPQRVRAARPAHRRRAPAPSQARTRGAGPARQRWRALRTAVPRHGRDRSRSACARGCTASTRRRARHPRPAGNGCERLVEASCPLRQPVRGCSRPPACCGFAATAFSNAAAASASRPCRTSATPWL